MAESVSFYLKDDQVYRDSVTKAVNCSYSCSNLIEATVHKIPTKLGYILNYRPCILHSRMFQVGLSL